MVGAGQAGECLRRVRLKEEFIDDSHRHVRMRGSRVLCACISSRGAAARH
jgi:hypothetical protein